MKYLIVGLGNIGNQYTNTRHNIGFMILDALAEASNVVFKDKRYGFVAETSYKGRTFQLLKPSTFVNLSGNAVRYWLNKAKVPLENLLVVVDDIALDFGTLRLRKKGGPGSHNGLNHISQVLGNQNFARLRFGIGNEFPKGAQVHYVLGEWTEEEVKVLPDRIQKSIEVIQAFGFLGIELAMTQYNSK